MAAYIEGVGDEVLWLLLFIVLTGLVSLAWLSTGIPPFDYYVWFVPRPARPNRRIVQIPQVNDEGAGDLGRNHAHGRTERALEDLMDGDFPDAFSAHSHTPQQPSTNVSDVPEVNIVNQIENDRRIESTRQLGAGGTAGDSGINSNLEDSAVMRGRHDCEQRHDGSTTSAQFAPHLCSNAQCEAQESASHALADIVANSINRFHSLEDDNSKQFHSVRLKFLDDSQFVVSTTLECTVGQFKRRFFWDPILSGKVVRLIFRGQLLRDDSRSLSSYGLHDECVVHCHISSTPYAQPRTQNEPTQQNATMLVQPGIEAAGTAAAAIAAIAGTPFIPLNAASRVTRSIAQTYRGQSIEDNRSDPFFLRARNAVLRYSRAVYNAIMGPVPEARNAVDNLAEASTAAAQRPNTLGIRIGQYLHLILIVKFVALWIFVFLFPQYTDRFSLLLLTFISLFFATLLFSSRQNDNAVPTRIRAQ